MVAGAGPWTNFTRITLPLIAKPLTPLLISAFAFNFNNFVLVSLLTGGRPDLTDSTLPAGTTDILVSRTPGASRSRTPGQQFGLAAAISTVIFLAAAVTLVQMKLTQKERCTRFRPGTSTGATATRAIVQPKVAALAHRRRARLPARAVRGGGVPFPGGAVGVAAAGNLRQRLADPVEHQPGALALRAGPALRRPDGHETPPTCR